MTETQLQANVIELAELLGWMVYHAANVKGQLRARTSVGFPDLVIVHQKTGSVLFVECKSENGGLSDDQRRWSYALIKSAGNYYLFRPADWVNGSVESILKTRSEKKGSATSGSLEIGKTGQSSGS